MKQKNNNQAGNHENSSLSYFRPEFNSKENKLECEKPTLKQKIINMLNKIQKQGKQ